MIVPRVAGYPTQTTTERRRPWIAATWVRAATGESFVKVPGPEFDSGPASGEIAVPRRFPAAAGRREAAVKVILLATS